MECSRPQTFRGRRAQRGLTCIVFACSALLVVSCVDTGRSANADETSAPENPRSSLVALMPAEPGVALVDLDDAGKVAGWTTVNDPVMGGTSTSTITFGDGGLVFSGNISLENNGGFASVRSPQNPDTGRRAAGAKSLRVHAVGDGKTYLLKVGIAGQPWSYVQRFSTRAAEPEIYELPIEAFQPVGMRLEPAPDAPQTLEPANIDEVAFYILDKQRGTFEITVSAIDATR